jgi:hypothetical protein
VFSCTKENGLENNAPLVKSPSINPVEQPFTCLQNRYLDLTLEYEFAKEGKAYQADKFSYEDKLLEIERIDSGKNADESKEDEEFYQSLSERLIAELNSHPTVKSFAEQFAAKDVMPLEMFVATGSDCSDFISKFEILKYSENGFDVFDRYSERNSLTGEEEWDFWAAPKPENVKNGMQKAVRYTLHSRWGSKIEYHFQSNTASDVKSNMRTAMSEWRAAANYKFYFSEITSNVKWNLFCWDMGWKYFLRIGMGDGNYAGRSTIGNVPWAFMQFNTDSKKRNMRTYLHETGHTLGLKHEHQRPDRDNYIIYYPDSVQTGMKHNFYKMTEGSYNYYGSNFDFNSIMLYHSRSFGIEIIDDQKKYMKYQLTGSGSKGFHTAITMTKKDGSTFSAPQILSSTDISVIQQIYNY